MMKVNVLELLNGLNDRGVLSLNYKNNELLEACIALLNGDEKLNDSRLNESLSQVKDNLAEHKLAEHKLAEHKGAVDESTVKSAPTKKRGRPRKEKAVVSSSSDRGDDLIASLVAEAQRSKQNKASDKELTPELDDSEEAIKVKKIDYDGDTYLISDKNIIFSFADHEEIGFYKDGAVILN